MENILFEIKDHLAIITINRPDKLNALNFVTMNELKTVIEQVYDNEVLRGAIITGAGNKSFVAGADITEIANLDELSGKKVSENGQEVFALIENSPKPFVAAINGYAIGGGCELAMACHMRVAAAHAQFAQPEVNLGIIPGYGGTQRMTQLIGKSKAIELICTGDYINADEAMSLGLVNYVVDSSEVLVKSKSILEKIFSKPRLATSLVIEAVNSVYHEVDGYQVEANAFNSCTNTGDFKEGTSAFLQRRKPNFES
jgi:enoyl-CoA hydratase